MSSTLAMRSTRSLGLALAATAIVSLGGCVSLLPKTPPAQLYRFGETPAPTAESGPAGQHVSMAMGSLEFAAGSSGDRILTMNGSEAAYIAGARWVAPAETLFQAAVERAFAASPVRLSERREALPAAFLLQLQVENFEVRYTAGPKGAPSAYVAVRARIVRSSDRAIVGERRFEASVAAGDNRVGAIVPVMDEATTKVLGELTGWSAQLTTGG